MTRINLIPNEIYRQLFHENQAQCPPDYLEEIIKQKLDEKGMGEVRDNTLMPDIPIPILDKPLPKWVDHNVRAIYGKYHQWNEELSLVSLHKDIYEKDIIPAIAPTCPGWSKWNIRKNCWEQVETLPKVLCLDFEAYNTTVPDSPVPHYLPFICGAIDLEANWYCWIAEDFSNLPKVVNFPGFEYGIGHNIVSFDRRYIKECYEDFTPVRFFDTFSMYNILMGMASQSQRSLYLKFKNESDNLLPWMQETCLGSLDALYEYFTGGYLDKTTRSNIQLYNPDELKSGIDEIWQYCAKDVLATLVIFKHLWAKWKKSCPSMATLAGQIERSCFRLGVVKDYYQRLADMDRAIKTLFKKRNDEILEWLKISEEYEPLKQYALQWIKKEYEYRKSKANCPDKIKPKSYKEFINALWVKSDKTEIKPSRYIPITNRALIYALQLKWQGCQLEYRKDLDLMQEGLDGWGIFKDGEWIKLPHPKGSGNVGTPLAKDFKNKAVTGEFYSPVTDIVKVFETISTISTWQSFRDRMYSVYIYNNYWLTDIVPSGTVSERIVGTAVVLPNTNPNKAGTEIKHLFGINEDNRSHRIKLSGDYASQENFIFSAIADSHLGYIGSTPSSVLTLSGTDAHDRTGNIILNTLTEEQRTELENAYGSPLVKKLRTLWKNINYANQFLCGKNKQAGQIFLAVQGKLPYDVCYKIASDFIDESRGVLVYGKYTSGFASEAYNGCKENMQKDIQKSFIFKRHISAPLQKQNCFKDFATTRFNWNIQQTGQELINICMITMRIIQTILANKGLYLQYNIMNVIHDEILIEIEASQAKDMAWLFQIGHIFSKCMLYYSLNIKQIPITGLYLETVEFDWIWRKTPLDEGITPSNDKPTPPGKIVDVSQCVPKSKIDMYLESLPLPVHEEKIQDKDLEYISFLLN